MDEEEASCPGVAFRHKNACFVHLETVVSSLWDGKKQCRELGLKQAVGCFCWRLAEEKQLQERGCCCSCSHQKGQTLRLSNQSLCCR